MLIMTGNTLMDELSPSRKDVGLISYYLFQGDMWLVASAICMIVMSVIFMLIAAWKVNPMNSFGGRKKKKG